MARSETTARDTGRRRRSLVDGAEEALRDWLLPGRHRPGERLPPEQALAKMLGISRGTLRAALARLETSGEIVRRQGSGTYVGQVVAPRGFDESLDRLESYSSIARRRGVALSARDVRIERAPADEEVRSALGLAARAVAVRVSRLLFFGDEPGAIMEDTVHPDIGLPPDDVLEQALAAGDMVIDVLLRSGTPVAYSSTRIRPFLLSARSAEGRALGVRGATAALELEEVVHTGSGAPVMRSRDLFAPDRVDLEVIRRLEVSGPVPVAGRRRK